MWKEGGSLRGETIKREEKVLSGFENKILGGTHTVRVAFSAITLSNDYFFQGNCLCNS